MSQTEIYQQDWCKDLIKRLGRKKELEAEAEILAAIVEKQGRPFTKLVATYGEQTVSTAPMTEEEVKFSEINFEIRVLNAAINSLEEMVKLIIVLKYVERVDDWHIIELVIPKKFTDRQRRPLYISDSTYRRKKKSGLMKIGKLLGYFAK